MTKNPHPVAIVSANIFGTLGYMSLIIQWLWTGVLVAYPLLTKERLGFFLPDTSVPTPHPAPVDYGQFTPLISILAVVIALLVVIATVYALVRLPSQIGKKGQRLTQAAATGALPVIKRKPISKKQRTRLVDRITWGVKLVLIILPVLGLFFASTETGMSRAVILAVGALSAVWSSICFLVQLGIAKLYRLPLTTVW